MSKLLAVAAITVAVLNGVAGFSSEANAFNAGKFFQDSARYGK